jgi:hypothetical protein
MNHLREMFSENGKQALDVIRARFKNVRNKVIFTSKEYYNPDLIDVEVYKSCPASCKPWQQCKCLAVKMQIVRKGSEDKLAIKAHSFITHHLEYSQAAIHFNKYVGYASVKNEHFLAMEFDESFYPEAPDLSTALKLGILTEYDFKVINFQLIKALIVLQKRIVGACHNDLHLQNIILVRNHAPPHACRAISISGQHFNCGVHPFLVRCIDFELFTDLLNRVSTKKGLYFFEPLKGNSIFDFCRFASQAVLEIPKSWKSWKNFAKRWLPPEFLEGKPNKLVSKNALIPTLEGAKVLNQMYGWGKKSALLQMLDDPYFEEFEA